MEVGVCGSSFVIVSDFLGCGKKDYLRVRIEDMRTGTGGLRR